MDIGNVYEQYSSQMKLSICGRYQYESLASRYVSATTSKSKSSEAKDEHSTANYNPNWNLLPALLFLTLAMGNKSQ